MTEPVVKIPLSLAKSLEESFRYGFAISHDEIAILRQAIKSAECEASLDQLTALAQSNGEYEK